MWGISIGPVLIGTFIGAAVEVTEIVIIVVGVGTTRGWRSTLVGAGSGLIVLGGIVGALGQALTLLPIDPLRITIGALLLTFGLQWLTQGVIGVAADGFTGVAEEEETEAEAGGGPEGLIDWTAWLLAFKGVLLEGLEIAFIVLAFGAGSRGSASGGGYPEAYAGAAAAFIIVGIVGAFSRSAVEKVPGRVLKFAVGGLLSTFGTFWALEGLGVHWPWERLSLAWLYALYLGTTIILARAAGRGWLGPAPEPSLLGDLGASGPLGVAPASRRSVVRFQRSRSLPVSGIVDSSTQAAMRAERIERSGGEFDPDLVVDPADPEAVRSFQAAHGMEASGVVDARTRGALRVAQFPGLFDSRDTEAVRRFQLDHGQEPTGRVDAATRAARRSVIREESSRVDDEIADPLTAFESFDPVSPDSVRRFQLALDLGDTQGDVEEETQGALSAMRDRLGKDIPAGDGLDPSHPDQVRDLQRSYGLEPTGTIDEPTRQAIRWETEHKLGIDVASMESVERFQLAHDLAADGVVGPKTQAAMRAARHARTRANGHADSREHYGAATDHGSGFGVGLDAADPASVREFQRNHDLEADGVIGPNTQAALRAVRSNREGRRSPNGGGE